MSTKTTDARIAMWNAIEACAALNPGGVSVFKRKFKHETGEGGTLETIIQSGLGDMPSIEIMPGSQTFKWQTQRMAEFPYNVDVRLIHTRLYRLEQYAQDIIKAVWQQAPPASAVPYIKSATGYNPQSVSVSVPTLAKIGDRTQAVKAWAMTLTFQLQFQYDPFGSTD
jgi:hypothetical protein